MTEPQSPDAWWPLFQRAMSAGDLDAVLALYEPEAAFVQESGRVRTGQAELREVLAPLAAAKADFQVNVTKTVRSEELALLHSDWRISRPRPTTGYALEVLRRQPDGRWLLAIGDPFTVGQQAPGAPPSGQPR